MKQVINENDPSLAAFPGENPNPVLRVSRTGILVHANKSSQPVLKFWKIVVGKKIPRALCKIIKEVCDTNKTVLVETPTQKDIYEFVFVPIKKTNYIDIYASNITKSKYIAAALLKKQGLLKISNNETTAALREDNALLEEAMAVKTVKLLKAQLELERAKRLSDIGFLASTVAHELRNPLAAINLAAANIKRKAQNLEIETNLNTITKKIFESDQIINNLLFYTKLGSVNLTV